MSRIAIIQGHPDPRGHHFGHALAAAYVEGADEAGHTTRVMNVATFEFPFLRCREDLEQGTPPGAISSAQAVLADADHIVMIYPVWNGAMPALLKAFLEQTFRPAFIFPEAKAGQRLGFFSTFTQRKGLSGKSGRVIATMQMPAFVYRWYFHPHPEKNTLKLAGISPLRETLIGHVESRNAARRQQWLRNVYAFGQQAS